MNRPTPPGPLHTGAKLGPDESTMTTDTPRTDIMVTGNSDPTQDEYEDLAAFARQLERECTALREAVKPATEELTDDLRLAGKVAEIDRLRNCQLEDEKAELLTALKEVIAVFKECVGSSAFTEFEERNVKIILACAAIAKHQGRA